MALAYKVKLEYNWGFSASVPGLAKTNPTHPYPPITTILGAIAEAIAKQYKLGETSAPQLLKALSQNILVATYRAVNYVPVKYQDINKIIVVKESGKIATDAPARGKTITVPLTPGEPPILEAVISFREDRLTCCSREIIIEPDLLWEIHRTGSKESLVNVWSIEEVKSKIEISNASKIITRYAFPLTYIEQINNQKGTWEVMWQVDPYKPESWHKTPATSYTFGKATTPYMVPVKPEEPETPCFVEVTLKPGFAILDLDGYKAIGRRVKNGAD